MISLVLRIGPLGDVLELGAWLVAVVEGALLVVVETALLVLAAGMLFETTDVVGGDITVDAPAAEVANVDASDAGPLTAVVGFDVLVGDVKLAELPAAGPSVAVLKKYTVVASAAQT